MYQLLYHPSCQKQLKKLSLSERKRLFKKINQLAERPFAGNLDVKKLVNTKRSYRLRVGDLRLIFELDNSNKRLYVWEIGWRGQIY